MKNADGDFHQHFLMQLIMKLFGINFYKNLLKIMIILL